MLTVLLMVGVIGTAFILFGLPLLTGAKLPTDVVPIDYDTDGDGTADLRLGFSFFQALRIVFNDGTDHWNYPATRTQLLPLLISEPWANHKPITSSQAYVFFKVTSSKQITQVAFTAQMKVAIHNNDKSLLKDLGEQPLNQVISNPQNNTDVYITSATISATDIETLLNQQDPLFKLYYWVISCRDISAAITFTDGKQLTVVASGVQQETNQLWWQFEHQGLGSQLSIIDHGVATGWV